MNHYHQQAVDREREDREWLPRFYELRAKLWEPRQVSPDALRCITPDHVERWEEIKLLSVRQRCERLEKRLAVLERYTVPPSSAKRRCWWHW